MAKRSASSSDLPGSAASKKPALALADASAPGMNAAFLDRIHMCLMEIQKRELFVDIQDEQPLGQQHGGREAPLDPTRMAAALSSGGYLCVDYGRIIIHA